MKMTNKVSRMVRRLFYKEDVRVFIIGFFTIGMVLVLAGGFTFGLINGLEKQVKSENQTEYLAKEIPGVIRILEDKSNVLYDSENDRDLYIATTKKKSYSVSISKKQNKDSSYDYEMHEQVLTKR